MSNILSSRTVPLFKVTKENIDKTLKIIEDAGIGLAKIVYSFPFSKCDMVENGLE